jgi:hypothetical protein
MGGIAGGVVSEIYGGNFWEGFVQGAATAAAAFLFNHGLHSELEKYVAGRVEAQEKLNKWIQEQGWKEVEIGGKKFLVDKSGNPIGEIRITIKGGNLDLVLAGAGIAKPAAALLSVHHPVTLAMGIVKIGIGLWVILQGLPSIEVSSRY